MPRVLALTAAALVTLAFHAAPGKALIPPSVPCLLGDKVYIAKNKLDGITLKIDEGAGPGIQRPRTTSGGSRPRTGLLSRRFPRRFPLITPSWCRSFRPGAFSRRSSHVSWKRRSPRLSSASETCRSRSM